MYVLFFFKQKTAYEMRISDWSSDVCSSDLQKIACLAAAGAIAGDQDQVRARQRRSVERDRAINRQDGGSVVLRRAQFEKTLQLAQAMRNRHVAVNLEPDTAPVAHPLAVFVLPILVVAEHPRIHRRLSQPVAPFRFPGDQAADL